jgi:hypothetical protein
VERVEGKIRKFKFTIKIKSATIKRSKKYFNKIISKDLIKIK